MSASLLGAAMKAKLGSRTRKLVLIKLVDCCHEDGTNIYPALATVAEDAECSIATARRTLKEFVAVGLLRKIREGGVGRKSTNHYEMDVELLFRLRRPEFWPALEAAALHQPLPDNDDDEESSHAPDAREAGNAAPSCETKGSTVIPYHGDTLSNGAPRVSSDDTQPLSRTLNSEREGAGASPDVPASEGEGDGRPAASLDEFRKAYPQCGADDQTKVENAWNELPFDQRRAAIDGIPGFLAERKAANQTLRLAAFTYLRGRNWLHVPQQTAERAARQASSAPVEVKGWSREWWLLLFARIHAGKPPGFWVQQAESGRAMTVSGSDLAAAARQVGELKSFRCDGPEIEAWRPWLAAKGARIPVWRGDSRVFLAGERPPGVLTEDGDAEVKF